MKKVFIFSILLILGLVISQVWPLFITNSALSNALNESIRILSTICLGFIMIHVGYEFEIDKKNMRQYGWDYFVAATAAAFPWIFCAAYFVFVMHSSNLWANADIWKESLLISRFASPTSAGVLFSMLAAAGLAATWTFKKLKILAIFDDLDTILLLIPLKILLVGLKWQLGLILAFISLCLWFIWKYYRKLKIPSSWPYIVFYSIGICGLSEIFYRFSYLIDPKVPIHLEVLLPAFAIGCAIKIYKKNSPHTNDLLEGELEGPTNKVEQQVSTLISGTFMFLVGMSMPLLSKTMQNSGESISWGTIALHVSLITILSNIGKLFPAFCYRKEASFRERVALAVGMFPRGEVGAGVLMLALSYGIVGPMVAVGLLSLALNLLLTGIFIVIVKRLLAKEPGVSL